MPSTAARRSAAAAALLLTAGCAHLEKPAALAGWDRAPSPPAKMRMTLLSVGAFENDYADAVRGGENRPIRMPNIVAFVEHPLGNLLVDTGFAVRYRDQRRSFPVSLFDRMTHASFDAESDPVVKQLPRHGIDPASIRWVLLTHMHFDHAGGLPDLPSARVVVPRAEWAAAHRSTLFAAYRGYAPSMYRDLSPEAFLVEWPERPYATFERSVDLFGDGSIVLVDAWGHTPGSMAIFVNLPSGERFLFVGDAAWVRANYRLPAHKSWKTRTIDNGRRNVMQTLWRLKRLEELAPEVKIVPAHDPDVWAELKHAPHWYGDTR